MRSFRRLCGSLPPAPKPTQLAWPHHHKRARAARDLLTKQIALVTSLVTLGMTVAMAVKFSPNGPEFQFVQVYQWIPEFGVHYAVGVDGIALVLIGMTAVLMPVVMLASWHDADPADPMDGTGPARSPAGSGPATPRSAGSGPTTLPKRSVKVYFALMLVLETMVIGVFAATDVFLFYVFFEAMLIPMYFMIGSFGVGQRQYAAVKFLLYSLLGGLLMLVAVIALYVYSTQGGHQGTFLFSRSPTWRCPPTPSAGCSSGSSSRSRSRHRCGRSTPGCPTRRHRRSPARRCCWSACWTRSARSA